MEEEVEEVGGGTIEEMKKTVLLQEHLSQQTKIKGYRRCMSEGGWTL